MAEYNYESLKQIVAANGGLPGVPAGPAVPTEFQVEGTFTIDLGALQDEVLALKFEEESDQQFDLNVNVQTNDAEELTGIDNNGGNVYTPTTGGSMFLHSDRVMINAKTDFSMLLGEKGVAIASPQKVNIDAGKSITLFGHDNVFMGLPNRGEEYDKKTTIDKPKPKSVGAGTPDELYEPMVLGIKLINLIEDLIVVIENAEVAAPTGNGVFQPSTLAELELIKVRLPELLSTYAYVEGLSHEQIDEERLATVEAAKKKAEDFTPPRTLTGTFSGTATVTGPQGPTGPPPNPVTTPFAELPGYFETPSTDIYGDGDTL